MMKLYNLLLLALLVVATSLVSADTEGAAPAVAHSYTADEVETMLKEPKAFIPNDMVDSLGDFQFVQDLPDNEGDENRALRGSERRELNNRIITRGGGGSVGCNMCEDDDSDGPYRICSCTNRKHGMACTACWVLEFDSSSCDRFCYIGYP